jgi:AcrR family transcriptional regulator
MDISLVRIGRQACYALRVAPRAATRLARERPLRGTPGETRARLVAAAADLFNRAGYHGTDSNRIARRAGYAAGTFYKHFPDKREILLAAWEAWVGAEWSEVEAELRAGGERRDVAGRIVALVLRHHVRWRGLRASMAALLAEDAAVRRFHREQRRRQLDLLRAMRERIGAPPRPDEEDAVLLFTLERACDAIANGEVRDLALEREGVLRALRRLVAGALAPRRS